MQRRILVFVIFLVCSLGTAFPEGVGKHAITNGSADPGRFGDHVMGYAQARYLSYMTALPFFYRPFPYSDKINIEFQALPYDQASRQYSSTFYVHSGDTLIEFFRRLVDPQTPPTLFIIAYFPTDISEFEGHIPRSLVLHTRWDDPEFHKLLQQAFLPRIQLPNLRKEGCLNVADHVRTLSGGDGIHSSIDPLPLKHPKLSYHRRQIQKIYEWNLRKPMHVFLFSDTGCPLKLVENFREYFAGTNITFEIQNLDRPDTDHVLQDFYAMQQFDVLIATQSNLSMMASRIADFDMVIFPVHVRGKYPDSDIDRVQIVSKKSEWFPFDLDVIVKEEKLSTSVQDWFFEARKNN